MNNTTYGQRYLDFNDARYKSEEIVCSAYKYHKLSEYDRYRAVSHFLFTMYTLDILDT